MKQESSFSEEKEAKRLFPLGTRFSAKNAAQTDEVFLLLFVHKKKDFLS
jgi:hypothetical protein